MVNGAALILIPEALLRRGFALTVHLDDALGAEFHIRMDEYPQAVRLVLQDIVGAAADNDARPFFRQLGDDVILDLPQIVRVVLAVSPVRKRRGQIAAGRIFARVFDVIFAETALFRDFLEQFTVIAGDAQLLRHFFADRAAAAAEFTADGDDSVFHRVLSPSTGKINCTFIVMPLPALLLTAVSHR